MGLINLFSYSSIEDGPLSPQSLPPQPSPEEEVPQYNIMENCTERGRRKLVDSLGFSYTVKVRIIHFYISQFVLLLLNHIQHLIE